MVRPYFISELLENLIMKNIILALALTLSIVMSPLAVAQKKGKEKVKEQVDILKIVQEKAKKEKKNIMILFSGLEWCGPCQKFDKEVVKNKVFKDYAKKKLVFVEIDVKKNKKVDIKIDGKKDAKISKLKADVLKELRETLAKKFKVSGVPTAVVLSADGTVLQKHVGAGITAKEFVEKISSKKN